MPKTRQRKTFERWLYVMLLDPAVARTGKFKKVNPEYNGTHACYYVGSSVHDPETRFQQHKAGYKGSKPVKRFGKSVVTSLCRRKRVLSTQSIRVKERRYAQSLRTLGFGVVQG